MAWTITTARAGLQPITTLSTTKQHALGTIVQAEDPTLGNGEFIYLLGVSWTILGSIVRYDDGFQTALDGTATADASACCDCDGACTASYYGWYQIAGLAVAKKASATTFADGAGPWFRRRSGHCGRDQPADIECNGSHRNHHYGCGGQLCGDFDQSARWSFYRVVCVTHSSGAGETRPLLRL